MKNKPNMYRATYFVEVGNNYAGGLSKRVKYIESLGEVRFLENIKEIVHVYLEVGENVSPQEVSEAIKDAERKEHLSAQKLLIEEHKREGDKLIKAYLQAIGGMTNGRGDYD